MNPKNKALDRTYFIAGPPRVGKTLLSYTLADKIKGHVVSTDAIRSAAKKACVDKTGDLFRTNRENALTEQEWLRKHNENSEMMLEDLNKESVAFWTSIVSFCDTFCQDGANHIVEGVALLPSLVAEMESKPSHVVYIGNTNPNHIRSMIDFGQQFPEQDWMALKGYSQHRLEAMAKFVNNMSHYFKSEAEKYNFHYFEIDDEDFKGSLEEVCTFLLK
jgi:2-phosphoglycerate kinase